MYQYQDLHEEIRSRNNKAVIVFSGVIPMPGLKKYGSERIVKQLNARLEKLAATRSLTIYVNSANLFAHGSVVKSGLYNIDGIHLNSQGVDALNNWFGQVIGKTHLKEKLGAARRQKLGRKNWWN